MWFAKLGVQFLTRNKQNKPESTDFLGLEFSNDLSGNDADMTAMTELVP